MPDNPSDLVPTLDSPTASRDVTALSPSDTAEFPPACVAGYDLLAEVGRGGMGVVYKATHRTLNRTVALKMVLAGSHAGPIELGRFRQEAETVARLQHPNIVQIYEVGTHAGHPYLVLEYVEGGTLAQKTAGVPQPPRDAARLVELLARAVDYAHQNGVIHRDLKPGNILLTADGAPKLSDFGLARRLNAGEGMTVTGAILGTPGYLAPEQARASATDLGPATDVHGLGATLYYLLTGRPPFQAATQYETILETVEREPARPSQVRPQTPADLETICLKCLEKQPHKRYARAADLAEDLRRFLADEPIRARPVGAAERAAKWLRRNPTLSAAVAGVVLALAIATAVSGAFALTARREAGRAAASERLANEKADALVAEQENRRRRTVRLSILTGARYLEAEEPATALLFFQQAWDVDRPNPETESSHRARVAGLLRSMPELLGACFHRSQVEDAAFSPDGVRLFSRLGRKIHLWDFERSQTVGPPLTHAAQIRHACWSPDGSTIATASEDGTAAVWDARTGARRHLLAHGRPVNWVAYHPTQSRLVTAAEDGKLRLWDAASGKQIDWPFPTGAVTDHVAFSADGSRIVTAGRDNKVRVWTTYPPAPVSPPLPYRASTPTERYRFHYRRWPRFGGSDGRSAISFQEEKLIVWPGDGAEYKTFALDYRITEVHPIPGTDRVLATGDKYNRVAVVSIRDGKEVHVLSHPRQANVGCVSPDGKYLMTASSGGLIHLRDAATARLLWPPQKCGDFASAVAVSADGKRCLAASQDGTVRVWAVEPSRVEVGPYQPDGRGNHLTLDVPGGRTRAASPDGKLAVEYGGGPARFGPTTPNVPMRDVGHPEAVEVALFSADGGRFVLFGREVVRVWDARAAEAVGPPVRVRTEGRGIGTDRLARLSADGSRVAVWDDERSVSVWDLIQGRRVFGPARLDVPGQRIFGPPETDGYVTGMILSADGKRLAQSIDSAGALTVWDVDAGRVAHHTPKRFQGYSQGFAFSSDGRRILLWSSDNNARTYDSGTGAPIGPAINPPLSKEFYVRVHPDECAASSDGQWLAFFEGGLGAVRVYDARYADKLLRVPLPPRLLRIPKGSKSPISRMWFSPNGSRIHVIAAGEPATISLPRFEAPAEQSGALALLLTGHRIETTDGIDGVERLDPATFRNDPHKYRRAFLAWKGLPDDPDAKPPGGAGE